MRRMNYVLGLMFNPEQTAVGLIRKAKPAWQKGYLNGIGGKIEEGDVTPRAAMAREFFEETRCVTTTGVWRGFLQLQGPEFEVYCFVTVGRLEGLTTVDAEEPVVVVPLLEVSQRRKEMLGNLAWIIFLGLDHLNDTNLSGAVVSYV